MNKFNLRFLSSFILFSIWTLSNAQNSEQIYVIDSLTKEPVSYSIIRNLKDSTGFYSNIEGQFDKKDLIGKEIEVSSIGYYSKETKLTIKSKYINLKPKNYTIDEVIIKPQKYKTKKIGYANNKDENKVYQTYTCGSELAVFIKNPNGSIAFINKIIIDANINARKIKELNLNFVSVFKINMYSIGENEKIGEIINKVPLIFTSKNLNKKTTLDISQERFLMPNNGVFISIEWVGIENQVTKEIKTTKEAIEPFIGLSLKPSDAIVYKRNKLGSNRWQLYDSNDIILKNRVMKNYIPKISIEIAY